MVLTLAEIAQRLGARLVGDGSIRIHGAAGIREAGEGEITFLANPRYSEYLPETRASAAILPEHHENPPLPAILASDPYLAYLEVLRLFEEADIERPAAGIHPSAHVDPTSRLGVDVAVGAMVVIGAEATVGDRTVVMAGAYIGPETRIGSDCVIHPCVVVLKRNEIGNRVVIHAGAIIGADGFGFAPDGQQYRKIPQLGRVVIEDDADIGANTTIDRATTGVTRIGRGARIDNLVMIAHNVEIGENTVICAQTGISGSVRVGRHVILAGQVGIVGHVEIGDGARVGAQGGVTRSVPPGVSYSGYPAQPHARASRGYAALRHLPEALRDLRKMELRLRSLEERLGGAGARDDSEGA